MIRLPAILALVVFGSALASGAPISWNIVSSGFPDGGALSGSFVYDPTTLLFTSVDVTTTSGSSFAGAHYTTPGPSSVPMFPKSFALITSASGNLTGTPALYLTFPGNWWNGGASATAVIAADSFCMNAACSSGNFYRQANSATLTASTPTPEPAAVYFTLIGILAMLVMSRIQTRLPDRRKQ
jgi:hypothetical protein